MIEKLSSDQKGQEVKSSASAQTKKCFAEPKLKFIKPKLTKHGNVTTITKSGDPFFTTFPGSF